MIPVEASDAQVAMWEAAEGVPCRKALIGGPEEGDGIIPCPTLVSENGTYHVAWQLDEIELAHLAQGGALWLTCYGGLPIHDLQIEIPERMRGTA